MFGSEVLDAAAIGAGAALLGGIIAGVFSLLTKRAESEIKALELTIKERMKVFSDIVAAIADANERIDRMYRLIDKYDHEVAFMLSGVDPSGIDITAIKNKYADCRRDFVKIYDNNRLYLPVDIDRKIKQYVDKSLVLPRPHYIEAKDDANDYELDYGATKSAFDAYLTTIKSTNNESLERIIIAMQKCIGFK